MDDCANYPRRANYRGSNYPGYTVIIQRSHDVFFVPELMAKTKGDKVKTLEAKTNAILKQGCMKCQKLLNTTTVQRSTVPSSNLPKKLTIGSNTNAELHNKPTATANKTLLTRQSESSSDEDGYGSELLKPGHVAIFVAGTGNKDSIPVVDKSPKSSLALSRKKNVGKTGSPQEHASAFTRVAPKRQSTEESEQVNKRQRVLNAKPGPLNSGITAQNTKENTETFKPPQQPSAINTNFSNDVRLTRRKTRSMDMSHDSSHEEKIIRLEAKIIENPDSAQPKQVTVGAKTKTVQGLKRPTHTNTSSNLTKIPYPTLTEQELSKTQGKSSAFTTPHQVDSTSNTSKEQSLLKPSQLSKFAGTKKKLAGQTKVGNC